MVTGYKSYLLTKPVAGARIKTKNILAWDVTLAGSYEYSPRMMTGLHIFNVTNPASPTRAHEYDIPSNPANVAIWQLRLRC